MASRPLLGGDPIPLTVVRIAVGLAFGTVGILLELGLDQVVAVAPWLVVGFGAGLGAAILGGALGGTIAGAIGVAGQAFAIPGWVPAVWRAPAGRSSWRRRSGPSRAGWGSGA